MESQIRWHGYTPEGSLISIAPRQVSGCCCCYIDDAIHYY